MIFAFFRGRENFGLKCQGRDMGWPYSDRNLLFLFGWSAF